MNTDKTLLAALAAATLVSACSQNQPSTSDGRVSPFSPGYEIDLRAPQAPGPAAMTLAPSLGGASASDDPYTRAVQCAAAVERLGNLARQLAGQLDRRSLEALDRAQRYYRDEARRIAGPDGRASVDQAVTDAIGDKSISSPDAARMASTCLRIDTPPDI